MSLQTGLSAAQSGRFFWCVTRDSIRKLIKANGPFLASALAFDLVLYSIPLLLVIVSALGHTAFGSERAASVVRETVTQFLPDVEQVAVEGLASAVANRKALGVTGLVLLVVFGSTTVGSARASLNALLDVERPRGFFHGKGIDILMIGVISGLFGVTIALNSALGAIRTASQRVPLLGDILNSQWFRVTEVLGLLFVLLFFLVMYRICPRKRFGLPALVAASLTATVLLQISRWAFGWYVTLAQSTPLIYGALGGLLFFVLWVYYSSLVFLYGAVVGWAVEQQLQDETVSLEPAEE